MNFSKKNHEHKGVNLKSVSKKIILSIVFVFASLTMVNASSDENLEGLKANDKIQISCEESAAHFAMLAYDAGFSVEDAIGVYDAIMANCTD